MMGGFITYTCPEDKVVSHATAELESRSSEWIFGSGSYCAFVEL